MVVQAVGHGQEARVPSFTSSRFINTDIGGISVARYTASRPMQTLAKSLLAASQGNQVAFGGYVMLPDTLRNTIDSVHRNPFIFDALLSIVHDGTSTYWRDTRPANRSVREIQRGDAYKTLLEGLQIPRTIGRGGHETEASKATREGARGVPLGGRVDASRSDHQGLRGKVEQR